MKRLPRKGERYHINQSPLFRIGSKKQLLKRLGLTERELLRVLSRPCYAEWKDKKKRDIQQPVGLVAQVHSTLGRFLSRIETPEYVHHKKTRSYVSNAKEHTGYHPLVKTDISGYFPSVSRDKVMEMFINLFECPKDVAGILSRLCCYQHKHLPTGSCISGYVSFFANQHLFDMIARIAKVRGCTFTLYVDDLTISGPAATKRLINEVRQLILKSGMRAKGKKTRAYSIYSPKTVTGVIVRGNSCYLPNAQHLELKRTRDAFATATEERETLLKVLKGRNMAARQISKANEGEDYSPDLIYSR